MACAPWAAVGWIAKGQRMILDGREAPSRGEGRALPSLRPGILAQMCSSHTPSEAYIVLIDVGLEQGIES